ncbi:hypothetical protein KIN20_024876 [Parelaphostrongylus tenuis]|uniref:Uncharacterized protein n=1 Tax=Parelaphostrongylus tenuis TaxID=148309 RepID=A0AAD5MU58_PARTN|nr:hypothetical protein KIN20_024876 [Parelaphostrongylus tenuis]
MRTKKVLHLGYESKDGAIPTGEDWTRSSQLCRSVAKQQQPKRKFGGFPRMGEEGERLLCKKYKKPKDALRLAYVIKKIKFISIHSRGSVND